MRVLALALAAFLLLSTKTYAQAIPPAPAPSSDPSGVPVATEGSVAPSSTDQAATPEATAAAAPEVVEESIDPALLGGGAGELSAEELEELGFGGGAPSVDTSIKVFGFADFTFAMAPQKLNNPWRQTVAPHPTFYVGNFNMYLTKSLSQNVRFMSEVRFHYAPLGTQSSDGTYTITNASDPADFGRNFHWGGIEIQRIYLEWQIHRYLAVRTGQFLTPYGIWNVDHGSPLFIPVTRPYVIGSGLFPQRQTGLELLGQYDVGNADSIGYHFTLSNGMGPLAEIKDLDTNKGVGTRVFWENRKLGALRVGGSAFYAKDTSTTTSRSLDANQTLVSKENVESQSKVLSLAADVQWKYKGWHLQSEVITQQRKFTGHGRRASTNPYTGSPLFPRDYLTWGVYGLAGYGFDVHGVNVMPWAMVQSFDQVESVGFIRTKTNGVTLGVNTRPIDAVVVKLAWSMSKFPDGFVISNGTLQLLQAQVAWAF